MPEQQPRIGDDVLYFEVEGQPIAAKVTGFLEGGLAVLALFKPGETAITPGSGHFSEAPAVGHYCWPGAAR